MLPAHVAARELERRRAEERAEHARQLPLYVDVTPPPTEEEKPASEKLPDWAVNY